MTIQVLQLKENTDEFGRNSQLVQPVDLIRKLIADGRIKNRTRPLYAVNFGARDGKGEGGNTDPTYPLFAGIQMKKYCYISSVLILLCMCPHTTCAHACVTGPHTTTCVLKLLHMSPQYYYVSAYYYMCPHTTIHVSPELCF